MICGIFKDEINENVVWKASMQFKFNTDNIIIHNKERLVLGISTLKHWIHNTKEKMKVV